MAGKGDAPRPLSVERETFEEAWRRTFEPPSPSPVPPAAAQIIDLMDALRDSLRLRKEEV